MTHPARQWFLLQLLMDRLLRLDEQALADLSALSGKHVLIRLENPMLSFCLAPGPAGVELVDPETVTADAVLRCRMADCLALLFARGQGLQLPERVELSGDVHLLHDLHRICMRFSPDWQEPLSQVVGDTATCYLERMLSAANRRLRNSGRQFFQDLGEYLRYEKGLAPDAGELEEFYRAVDCLRSDAQRLEKRIQLLRAGRSGRDPDG